MFTYFFPGRELRHWRDGGGWGRVWGGDQLGPKIPQNHENISYENCSHFWDMFKIMYKNIFKIYSYIQKMSTNPINALKITIDNTKHTQNTTIHFKQSKMFERKNKTMKIPSFYFIIYQISIVHTSYILYIFYILYIIVWAIGLHWIEKNIYTYMYIKIYI